MNITDGPWIANIDHSGSGWRIETDAPGYPNDGWIIADMLGPDAASNAQAIAALPELLKLVREMEGYAKDFHTLVDRSGNFLHAETVADTLDRARALLARLETGE